MKCIIVRSLLCLFLLIPNKLVAQEKKVIVKFNEDETKILSKKIKKLSYQLSQELKSIEKKINLYINSEFLDFNDDLMFQIKENISQFLLTELNSFSKKFKLNQEIYSQKCKEFKEEEDNTIELYDISTNSSDLNENANNNDNDQNFLMTEEPDQLLQNRDKELDEIVRGVNNLQELFKDLHVIIIEQGTILDRIDYNIDEAAIHTAKGKQHLKNASELQKNSCFRNVMLFLVVFIFIESILLMIKFL